MRNLIIIGFIMQWFVGCTAQPTSTTAKGLYKNIGKANAINVEKATYDDVVDIAESNMVKTVASRNIASVNNVLVFKDCIFNKGFIASKSVGKIINTTYFKSQVVFINCTFEMDADFRHSVFEKEVQFQNCKFSKLANFEECTFAMESSFLNCSFIGEARFQHVAFVGKSSFMDSKFLDNSSYQNSQFSSTAQFGVTEYYKYADFSSVVFNAYANFNFAKFFDRGDFNQALFKGRMDANSTKLNNVDFTNSIFYGPTRFNESTVDVKLNLSGSFFALQPQFDKTDLTKVDLATAKVASTKLLKLQ